MPVVYGVHVVQTDPGKLLAVRVEPWGWASALTLELVIRRRLVEHVGTVSGETLEQVDSALRAALDL